MKLEHESAYFPILQKFCLALENTRKDYLRNKITFKVNDRIFVLTDAGESLAITVKSTSAKNKILLEHPQISVANYMGRFGWITIDVINQHTLELAENLNH